MRVFITGGTGLVGYRLVERLLARGDQPLVLTRRQETAQKLWADRCAVVPGDPTQAGDWMQAVRECDAVVHLAGENLFAHRWRTAFKERLRSSRVQGTANVARAVAEQPRRPDGAPKVFATASAIGFYGPCGDEELDEASPPGHDFLAQLCAAWEQAARPAADAGARLCVMRSGIILDPRGGALKLMSLPFRLFVGGPIASGRQYMSWIHHADVTGLILLALDDAHAQGPINFTAPNPVTNRQFSHTLGRVLHRPSVFPTPRLGLRVVVGEAADVIATGQRVLPRRAQELGYAFQFPDVEGALRDVLGRPLPQPANA
jgi:uncharacterized protein (TIGR01777 family)